MEPFTVAAVLLVIGVLLLIVEAVSPGAFMLIPGAVLSVLGLFGMLFPDILFTWVSPVIAIVIAVPTVLLTLVLYRRLGSPEPPSTTVSDSLVGRKGKVVVATSSEDMRGKVKIDHDVWSATSDGPIAEGASVVVVSSEGVHVHVKEE